MDKILQDLIIEMKSIFNRYKSRNQYPYELYTLMCVVADNKNYEYDMNIHIQLMDLC